MDWERKTERKRGKMEKGGEKGEPTKKKYESSLSQRGRLKERLL